MSDFKTKGTQRVPSLFINPNHYKYFEMLYSLLGLYVLTYLRQ